MVSSEKIHILGIGDDGLEGLTTSARQLVERADLLMGEEGVLARCDLGTKFVIGGDLDAAVARLDERPGERIVVLASGDPLFYGFARYLCDRLGKDRFEVIPHVSSMQLAFARVKESWEEAYLTNLATHSLASVVEKIRVMDKVGLFTTQQYPPWAVAKALLDQDIDYFSVYVCENLGSPDERVTKAELDELCDQQFSPLNVMILVRKPNAPDRPRELVGRRLFGNPDEAFRQSKPKYGLLTPAEVRSMALAELDIGPHSVVWDVGAGSGSVAVEAACIADGGKAYAIEMDQEDFELIKANAQKFGCANLVAILGRAPEAWADLPDPDCVFVGGSGREISQIVELAYARLKSGGRLVANVASIENFAEGHETLMRLAGDVRCWMINVARGTYQLDRVRFDALNPCFLLSVVKNQ
ncbi:MAG: precorrin-6y C5,15-methyltransferase (decarboxylating) subunit CbiE [Planctomycetales bacterium]|nr:precorrin-6y C5,15-methyltransferase (decarboxylating) subunit CbiE [Planctomycetales bacterium]NIM10294.1 precorrin-6y C5,15-methyltransferase (decarboxylating) subunit CbiE [Planctomycetales bacterium]NIN09733.1 precorrin-6y C5,15-methyltransferase (decarboxylating) subunit CbiE [Planctomycetales bacterium]NIN78858.1 precorrin-6y C5,15-methyltransferase (decarboxylating) subunit CbiE [Planctomycetales bacterium]NIO36025.1 precorrin-6y C5,15-methyltransferase (decarboxylating) subunit CbiE 